MKVRMSSSEKWEGQELPLEIIKITMCSLMMLETMEMVGNTEIYSETSTPSHRITT
jgi:hypothetical protein